MYVSLNDWLTIVEDDYLSSFVAGGGATVKCVVTAEHAASTLVERELERLAHRHHFHYAFVDAMTTRLHMIEQIFFQIARGIDWDGLARTYLRGLLAADGFAIPSDPQAFTYSQVADANTYEEAELRRRVRVLLRDHLAKEYALTQEFRTAM